MIRELLEGYDEWALGSPMPVRSSTGRVWDTWCTHLRFSNGKRVKVFGVATFRLT